jgi:5-methylcytosine-specific restriction endonuclease McrA
MHPHKNLKLERLNLSAWSIEKMSKELVKIRIGTLVYVIHLMYWTTEYLRSFTNPVWLTGLSSPNFDLPRIWLVKGHLYISNVAATEKQVAEATKNITPSMKPKYFPWYHTVSPKARLALEVQLRQNIGMKIPKSMTNAYAKIERHVKLAERVPSNSRYIPQGIRIHVSHRDNGRCVKCGCNDYNLLEFDHLIAFSKGGRSDDPLNIRLLCRPCNRKKGAKTEGSY